MKSEVYIKDGMTRGGRLIKNSADIFLAAVFMILSTPLWIIIYIAIKKEDNGPVLYKQERIGKFGRPFYILKFRSMRIDAEQDGPQLYQAGVDERMTKVGKFLREHHLDELPQLINILLGDMSLVGPRPVTEPELVKYGKYKDYVLSVTPGLTGMWQVSGRSDTGYEERISFDTYYIQNWSIWLDIWILIKTVWVVLKGKGAY